MSHLKFPHGESAETIRDFVAQWYPVPIAEGMGELIAEAAQEDNIDKARVPAAEQFSKDRGHAKLDVKEALGQELFVDIPDQTSNTFVHVYMLGLRRARLESAQLLDKLGIENPMTALASKDLGSKAIDATSDLDTKGDGSSSTPILRVIQDES